ncbi:MAG: hypothetical protein COA42_21545 [Alteromonadaceae bacterium]|nr:MAG: hypothetical protein COA42_21545 [Alteromonadaceae bacterium]
MKTKFSRAIALVTLLLASYSINAAQENKQIMNIEEKKVLATIESMTAAFHAKDIDGVLKSYAPKANVVFEAGMPITDKSQMKEMFQGAFSIDPRFEYSGHEVFIADDVAVHIAPWVMTGKAPDGTKIEQSGLSVAVLKRQESGDWLMVIDNPHGGNLEK